ncbi:MAG: hypothetical protein Q7U23_05150 [Methylococcales bacterium]|nr:hypothetical protein [Methylococcales bacterium]
MKILRACITSKTVAETKHGDDYLGHYCNLVPSIKVIDESNIVYNCLFYSSLNNLDIQEKNVGHHYNNEYLNEKVQAEREALEKRLNYFFSVNDKIIVVGDIKNEKFIIYAFYNNTKDLINLRKPFIDVFLFFIAYFIICIPISWIIFKVFLTISTHDNLVHPTVKISILISVFCLCFEFLKEFLKARKINNLLLKAICNA